MPIQKNEEKQMNLRAALFGTLVLVGLTGATFAQAAKPRPVKFTSVYTSFATGCKVFRASNGGDDAYLCRGVGGYSVRVYSSAASTHINAELKGSEETFTIATVSVGFDESKTRLEWRLANGKPFAVIMRVPRYGPVTDDHPYLGEVVGQELVISGLKGFEIDSSVNANSPGANAKAREIADKAYSAKTEN
jgi:hypothetical protein